MPGRQRPLGFQVVGALGLSIKQVSNGQASRLKAVLKMDGLGRRVL